MNLTYRGIYDSGPTGFLPSATQNATANGRATATTGAADSPTLGPPYQLSDALGSTVSTSSDGKLAVAVGGAFGGAYLSELFACTNQIIELTIAANDCPVGPSVLLRYDPVKRTGIHSLFSNYLTPLSAFVANPAGGGAQVIYQAAGYTFNPAHGHKLTVQVVQIGHVTQLTATDLDTTTNTTYGPYTYQISNVNNIGDAGDAVSIDATGCHAAGVSSFTNPGGTVKITRIRVGELVNSDRLVVFIGDSRTAGAGATTGPGDGGSPFTGETTPVGASSPSPTLPGQVATLLGPGYDVVNIGRSGWAMEALSGSAGIAAMIETDLIAPFDTSRSKKPIAVVWAGVNSCGNGTPVATSFAVLLAYCQRARSAGYRVIVCTEPDAGGVAGWTAWRASYNALILANASSFDGICRFDQTSLGTSSPLHPPNSGLAILAAAVKPAIDAVIAAETPGGVTLAQLNYALANTPVTVGGYSAGQTPAKVADLPIAPDNASIAAIKAKTDNLPAQPAAVGSAMAVADKAGFKLASDGVDAIVVEPGINLRQAASVDLAAAAGVLSGAGSGSVAVKGAGGSTTRIAATTDNLGNRSAVTLTPPA